MATRTVGLVRRRRPGHGIAVGRVAVKARDRRTVIARVIRRHVAVGHRRPRGRSVALVALEAGEPVIAWLSRSHWCRYGTASRCRAPRWRGRIAPAARRWSSGRRRSSRSSRCASASCPSRARRRGTGHRSRPRRRCGRSAPAARPCHVAVVAGERRRNVIGRLAGRLACRHGSWRRCRALRHGRPGSPGSTRSYCGRHRRHCVVLMCLRILAGAAVPLWHWKQVPGVTPEWSNRAGVHAEVTWQLSHSKCRHDVGRALAGRRCAVVATRAGAQHFGMVDPDRRCPRGRVVAGVAGVGRVDVLSRSCRSPALPL